MTKASLSPQSSALMVTGLAASEDEEAVGTDRVGGGLEAERQVSPDGEEVARSRPTAVVAPAGIVGARDARPRRGGRYRGLVAGVSRSVVG